MAPSFAQLGAAMAAALFSTTHAAQSYQISEEYTPANFFSKFKFFVSDFTTEDGWDPTHGFVNYRSQADAQSLNLISTTSSDVYIGVNHADTFLNTDGTPASRGRDSVRIESVSTYSKGLIVASFSHLPQQACGAWPAFWAYAELYVTKGEIDLYEGWNLPGYNTLAGHTDPSYAGACSLNSSSAYSKGTATTTNCNNYLVNPPAQYQGTGCAVKDNSGIWSSSTGGTFALEITSESVKVWNWLPGSVPADIVAGSPKPGSSWGLPELLITNDACDIISAFRDQKLVFNIDFCGDTAGNSALWAQSCSSKAATCSDFVAANPSAFADVYWQIEGIKVYQLQDAASSTSSASTRLSTSSVCVTSSLVVSSSSPSATSSTLLTPANSSAPTSASGSSTSSVLGPFNSTAVTSSLASLPSPSGHLNSTKPIGSDNSDEDEYCDEDDEDDEDDDEEYYDDEDEDGDENDEICDDENDSSVPSPTFVPVTRPSNGSTGSGLLPTAGSSSVSIPKDGASSGSQAGESLTASSPMDGAGSGKVMTSASLAGTTTAANGDVQLATVTIFSIQVYTITSCAPDVANCPVGSKTSTLVPVATTVFPVSKATSVSAASVSQFTTSTVYSTQTYTITSCAATVIDCPVGRVTTEVVALYTTICPVTAGATPTTVISSGAGSNGSGANPGSNKGSSGSGSGSSGSGSDSDSGSITSTIILTKTFTVTLCTPTITDCLVGKVTSSVVTTTTVVPATNTAVPGSGSNSGSNSDSASNPGSGSGSGSGAGGQNKAQTTTIPAATTATDRQTQTKSVTALVSDSNTKTAAGPGFDTYKADSGSGSGISGVAQATEKNATLSATVSATTSSWSTKATASASSSKAPIVASGAAQTAATSFVLGLMAAAMVMVL